MPDPTPKPPARIAAAHLLLAAALLAYALIIYFHWIPSYYGLVDEQGYLTTAKQLATHGQFARRQPDPYAFVGETMMQSPGDPTTYYLRQPIGYPLLCAAAYALGGPDAPFAVNPLLGLTLLVAVYVIGKELGSPLMGALTALVLALHPLVWYYTLMALSHIPDMAAATWTIACALLWRREGKPWQAALIALLLGLAVWLRYTNILLLLPLAFILATRLRSTPRSIILPALLFAGMLLPLAAYQAAAFGSALRTGYSAGGNAISFSLAWFFAHAPAMAALLARPGTGISALLLAAAIGLVILARRNRFALAVLLLWALPPLLLYTAYYGMPARNTLLYARFALSSFAPLLLLATLWPPHLRWRAPASLITTFTLAAAAILLNLANPFMATALDNLENQMLFSMATAKVVTHEAPPGSVIVAADVTHYFLDYAGDYTLYEPAQFQSPKIAARIADLTHQPREFDPARTQQIARLFADKSNPQLLQLLHDQLKNYADAGKPIYLVARAEEAPPFAHALTATLTPLSDTHLGVTLFRIDFHP